jgi:hypothetical protein
MTGSCRSHAAFYTTFTKQMQPSVAVKGKRYRPDNATTIVRAPKRRSVKVTYFSASLFCEAAGPI